MSGPRTSEEGAIDSVDLYSYSVDLLRATPRD
jgi:hypothetical protein